MSKSTIYICDKEGNEGKVSGTDDLIEHIIALLETNGYWLNAEVGVYENGYYTNKPVEVSA